MKGRSAFLSKWIKLDVWLQYALMPFLHPENVDLLVAQPR
jgi:hypothetical protein